MIIRVLQDLEAEENKMRQAKSSIKNLDKRITKAQNPSIRLSDISHTTSVTTAKSVAITVQVQTLWTSATQDVNQATTKVPVAARA